MTFKIGLITDSFRIPLYEAIEKAASLEVDGVQIYATGKELSTDMSSSEIQAIKKHLRDSGLVLSALCGDIGAYDNKEVNVERVKEAKRIVDLAVQMETSIITTHIGVLSSDKQDESYKTIFEACYDIGSYAQKKGAKFAIETGPESAEILREFLDDLDCEGIAVNMDPANLTMVIGDDARQATKILAPYIVHTHAKDGIMLSKYADDPRYSELAKKQKWLELPLGQGDVEFVSYLKTLKEVGFSGFLTIEREVGDNPIKDIGLAVDFLRKLI